MYRLIGRLEQGQLADLFRAERVEAKEPVVVKLFHPRTSDAAYARVVAEHGRQLQALSHPGLARVLDVGLVDQRLAIVRQDTGRYTLGLALQRLNTREVHLPAPLALTLALELLDAVQAAHAAGVVHGALTPGNVGLSDEGRVAVTDFGALAALQAAPALKKAFANRGRSSYRAPELSTGGGASVASDVYALGAITYELLTLREASTRGASVSTRAERLPPPSRLVRRLHSRIDPVIMRALEASASRRHKSCAEFAEGIREFLASQGGAPARGELGKFVGELFPNEVQLATLGPVPFEREFVLTDVAGVGSFEAEEVEPGERTSFSGGEVDDRTPTSDGLPVFAGEVPAPAQTSTEVEVRPELKTQPELAAQPAAAPLTWDAPAAEVPAPPPSGPRPEQPFKGRVKVVEDFAELAQKKPEPPPRRRKTIAKTIMTFALPFKREGDPSVPSYADLERRGARQVRVVTVLAALILSGTVTFTAWHWYRSTPDPLGTFLSYLPDPIRRELEPQHRPPPPPKDGKVTLKLPDFDKLHPEKAFNPNPGVKVDPPPPAPKDPKPEPKPVTLQSGKILPPDCYAAPGSGKVGYLTVSAPATVRVEVDGKRLCTGHTKVPVTPGQHRVAVIDSRSKQEYASTSRFEAGKIVKLSPVFQKR